jgi:DNA-binding CsgD family transcriptional regulator/catechol 2,3-dioxygenase-like lactoylglutathione lyase family enzyme
MKGDLKRARGRPRHADLLTPSEWRTVHAVQHGMTNVEIARRRGVSVDAVKYHVANALAKLGLPDRRALRAWFRAPRDGALAAERSKSMNEKALSGAIGQIARSVGDIGASEKWYRDTLGLPHLYTFGTLAFFDCGGTRLMLAQEKSGAEKESVLYLRVVDIAAAHTALQQRGVKFTHAPHMIHRHADGTEEWMAFFEDPDGRPLAIMAQVRKSQTPG